MVDPVKQNPISPKKGVEKDLEKVTMAYCCYTTSSIKEAIEKLARQLLETKELANISRANNLRQYYNLISKRTYMRRMETIINMISEFIRREFPEIQFKIELRIKSLLSFDAKLQLLQREANKDVAEGRRPRELFPYDVMAFRIIILDRKDAKGVDDCYRVLNGLLPFLVAKVGCMLMQTSGTVNTSGFKKEEHPEVIFPSGEIKILEEFLVFIKDYIGRPKDNGYQAGHVTAMDTKLNFYFEIQVETQTMFYNSTKTATHEGHKSRRYADIYKSEGEFDPTRVHMDGFYYYYDPEKPDEAELYDYIGLVAPRIHTPFATVNV